MTSIRLDGALRQAYRQSVEDVLVRHTRVGYVLVLILMPIGAVLDYLVYDDTGQFWPIFHARVICTLVLVPLFVLTLLPIGRRHIRLLSNVLVTAPAFAIAWMIFVLDGVNSTYYAGLNLMIIGTCLLLPYSGREAAAYCLIVIGSYATACLLHRRTAFSSSLFFNNLFFIVLTSIICVTARHYSTLRRIEDFQLRHELDLRNKELDRSYKQLEQLDRLKSEFFANVNHELRTPLTLILSPIEMLLHHEPPLPEEIGQTLVLVKNNGLRLLKLINDMLEVIRLEEGKLSIEQKLIDLSMFVPGIADSIRHLTQSKRIALQAEGSKDRLLVRGDPTKLEKVLLNLLTNAIKFTNPGGVITVRWSAADAMAVVEVQDTGIGIPEHELAHVFERFRQADGSSTRKYQGVGLGLSLAKELVDEHKGRLSVRSQVGLGTVFTMQLPIAAAGEGETVLTTQCLVDDTDPFAQTFRAADREGPVTRSVAEQQLQEVGQGPVTILVVDDEPDMRKYLVSILAGEYRVLQAADGLSGLAIARERKPDLMLLDLMLPGMDGLDVCRNLKRQGETEDIKIVLLTARADDGSKIEALQRGADDFLTKPFSSVEVKTRLKNLLRTALLQKDLRQRNTELQDTLSRLKATEAQLIHSEKLNALGSLAAGLLHEINNPLNYTLTAVQLLQDATQDTADQELGDMLKDIDEGMKRIRDIVTDLRAFAYPQQAEKWSCFDIGQALDSALRFTAHQCNGQVIERDLAADCPVTASKSHISQVLVNLLSNSLRAVKQVQGRRQPRINVSSKRVENRLEVRVWDNGTGIAPENMTRVFDPFFTTQQVGQGMGLGLSICHTIVNNHGGRIRLNSHADCFTEVVFDLPLATLQETEVDG